MTSTEVLIAGGGPVGMTLAYVLASYGVRSILVERNLTTTQHPKMDITNSRSMELFERIDLADRLRAVSVPDSQPFDVSWITTLTGHELHRFVYPGVGAVRERQHAINDGTQPSQPPMRVSQVIIEPVLKKAIDEHPLIDVRFGTAFEEFTQDSDGVTCTVRNQDGSVDEIRAKWLAGCDGGGSRVRTILDINLSGKPRTSQRFITHFKSTATHLLQRWGAAWHYQSSRGTLVAQNDIDTWTLLTRLSDDADPAKVDPAKLIADFVGEPIEFELLVSNAWFPHLFVADKYSVGRVFLAGDAAHQYIPTGGYGMNTGVSEAYDLGWKLAALSKGFAGQGLADSYEAERRPVALTNCGGSARHNNVRVQVAGLYSQDMFEETPAGEAARAVAAQRIAEIGNAENESFGIEHGYCYNDSLIVLPDPTDAPSRDPLLYTPSTTPGARLPSVYLADGSNLYDHLAPWFTLLVQGDYDTTPLTEAAERLGVPLEVVRVDLRGHEALYTAPAFLIRPDTHIAWRGSPSVSGADADRIIKTIVGRRTYG